MLAPEIVIEMATGREEVVRAAIDAGHVTKYSLLKAYRMLTERGVDTASLLSMTTWRPGFGCKGITPGSVVYRRAVKSHGTCLVSLSMTGMGVQPGDILEVQYQDDHVIVRPMPKEEPAQETAQEAEPKPRRRRKTAGE